MQGQVNRAARSGLAFEAEGLLAEALTALAERSMRPQQRRGRALRMVPLAALAAAGFLAALRVSR